MNLGAFALIFNYLQTGKVRSEIVVLVFFDDLLHGVFEFVNIEVRTEVVERNDAAADDSAEENRGDDAPDKSEDTKTLAALAVFLAGMDSYDREDPVEREEQQE